MTKDKGLTVFMTKNAEAEPWLVPHAFVPPPEFEFFKVANSSLIYAKSGTGMTAICRALEEYACNELRCLPVKWTPDFLLSPRAPSTDLAMTQFSGILSAGAKKILNQLPKDFKRQAKDDRNFDFIASFLHHYSSTEDKALLSEKVPVPKSFLINRETKLEVIAIELIKNMKLVGFPGGIWILVDEIEWSTDSQKEAIINVLRSILSTLPLFEITGFHFKLVLPLELERELTEIPARIKERVTASNISWEPKQLRMMIEKRPSSPWLMTPSRQIKSILTRNFWLAEACGDYRLAAGSVFSPDICLRVENYATEGLRRLNKNEWTAARKSSSLQLRFYPESSQVVVGMNSPRMLSQEELAIFSYLHKNEGRYCSKREIYNKAYLPFNTGGKGKELGPQDELTKEYDDLVNTAIHRLRKSIEPLPKDPIFLTMKKNQGYRLSLQAFSD
jgi:hypothetical protein